MRLDELATKIGAELAGDGGLEISGAAAIEQAQPGQIAFVANGKYLPLLQTTQASAVIVAPATASSQRVALLQAKDPYYAFMQAVVLLHGFRRHPHAGIHPKAHVEATAVIGVGTVLYPGVYVGAGARVGRDCILYPNAVVYEDCVLGDRVILHAGSVIGGDGFGFSTHQGVHHKIPQIGNVVIEDDVEIGANSTVDRAALGSTVIARGTKIDNLVAIGHNVHIGEHGLLVAQVGVAGSTIIGHHATMAGQVGVSGHLNIGDNVIVAAQSGVIHDVESDQVLLGSPAMPYAHGRRVYILFRQLPELAARLKKLEQALPQPQNEEP